jgi:hypothetical protein
MSDKVQDGLKATATKSAQYGPGELQRAADQAAWTKKNGPSNIKENPFLRHRIYTAKDLDRAKQFRIWRDRNPDKDDSQNPYSWKSPISP